MKVGWQTKTLGEVLVRTETVNPELKPDDEFDYIDVSSVSNKTFQIEETQRLKGKDAPSRARKLVRTNDILFATIRPTLQRIAIVPEEFDEQVCSTGYFVMRPQPSLHHKFLYYYLFGDGFMSRMEALQKGASYPAVTDAEVRLQEIPFPPLPEQQRIVTTLDQAFAGIATATANAEKNLANARELFQSELQSIFTVRPELVEGQAHSAHGSTSSPRTGCEGYKETNLGEVVDLLSGFPFKSASYTTSKKDVRLLRGDNIVQGSLRWEDVKRWSASDTEIYERFRLNEGDVVLAMDRPWVNAGLKRAQISSEDLPCLLVQRTARLRSNGKIDNRFLLYLVTSQAFINHIVGVQTGIGVPHISGQQIKDFQFLIPPVSEQRAIVAKLDELSTETKKLEAIYQQKLVALDALKKSILHQAFSGQLH